MTLFSNKITKFWTTLGSRYFTKIQTDNMHCSPFLLYDSSTNPQMGQPQKTKYKTKINTKIVAYPFFNIFCIPEQDMFAYLTKNQLIKCHCASYNTYNNWGNVLILLQFCVHILFAILGMHRISLGIPWCFSAGALIYLNTCKFAWIRTYKQCFHSEKKNFLFQH